MRNCYKIIVLFMVIYASQEVEITTSEPPNSSVEITTPNVGLASNETKAKPSFHPKPPGVTQIIPSSDSDSPNSTNSSDEILITTENYVEAQTVLEYQPLKPFHQPFPIEQIIPPGKPWPESASEDHKTTKPTKLPPIQTFPPDLVDRFPELTTLNKRTTTPNNINNKEQETITKNYVKPATVLGYKPITSFYYPRPTTLAQIVPPGKPWPASAGEYETTKGSSSATTLRPELVSRKTTTTKTPQSKKTKLPLVSQKTTTTTISTTEDSVKPTTVLEYEPITTFFRPHPVTPAQLIPPGKPWPASPEGYETTISSSPGTTLSPILEDRFPELVTKKTTTTTKTQSFPEFITDKPSTEFVESQTVLEYKPITSFFHPRPSTIAQLVPPGKPWPASPSQTEPPTQSTSQTLVPSLEDRFPELVSINNTTTKRIENKNTTKKPEQKPTTSIVTPTTRIILTYKPQRPWYHPRPGNTVGQVVPPGKPWPSSPSGYPSFSVTTLPPWLKESIDKDAGNNKLSDYKADELQSLKEERSLEPNALQYYGPSITAEPSYNIAMTPFTSGTQKTTISDIVDILKEVHNITLVSDNAAPKPSHLLPFDVDKGSQIGNPVVQRPPSNGHQQQMPSPVKVYDGGLTFEGPVHRERIFPNPKFVQEH